MLICLGILSYVAQWKENYAAFRVVISVVAVGALFSVFLLQDRNGCAINITSNKNQCLRANKAIISSEDTFRKGENINRNDANYKPIVSVNFQGGFGNQMFMYASLMGIADEIAIEARIPWNLPIRSIFNLSLPMLPYDWENQSQPIAVEEGKRYGARDVHILSHVSQIKAIRSGAVIYGYLQSWRYFDKISNKLRNEFTFRENIQTQANEIISKIKKAHVTSRRFVGVHVRRGDILALRREGYRTGNIEFFVRAVAYFVTKYGHPLTFVVASDDVQWCRENMAHIYPTVEFLDGFEAAVDMAVISRCDDIIFDVGTFGWWCSWLSGGDTVYMKDFAAKNSKIRRGIKPAEYFLPQWLGL